MDLYLPSDIQEIAGGIILNAAIDTTGNNKLVAQIIQALGPLVSGTATVEIKLADLMTNAKQRVIYIEGNAVPETVISNSL
jgi:hypothetical protein